MGRARTKRRVPCPRCGHNETVCHGFDKNGRQRYRCGRCRKAGKAWTFNKRTGTVFYRLRKSKKTVMRALQSYMECGSVAGVARTFECRAREIDRWTDRAAAQCAAVTDNLLCELEVICAMLDEIWSYAQNKKNEQWVFNAIDAATKLLIGFAVGPWNKKSAKKLVTAQEAHKIHMAVPQRWA